MQPIRLRCPQCQTTLLVPAGLRPSCPSCGFAGRSAALNVQAETEVEWVSGPALDEAPATEPTEPTPVWQGHDDAWGQPDKLGMTADPPMPLYVFPLAVLTFGIYYFFWWTRALHGTASRNATDAAEVWGPVAT